MIAHTHTQTYTLSFSVTPHPTPFLQLLYPSYHFASYWPQDQYLCVCACVCACVCMHIYTHTHTHTCIYICKFLYTCIPCVSLASCLVPIHTETSEERERVRSKREEVVVLVVLNCNRLPSRVIGRRSEGWVEVSLVDVETRLRESIPQSSWVSSRPCIKMMACSAW